MSPSVTCSRFVARNFYKNGQEEVISSTLPNRLLELPPLAARISGVFADAEAPGDESGNH